MCIYACEHLNLIFFPFLYSLPSLWLLLFFSTLVDIISWCYPTPNKSLYFLSSLFSIKIHSLCFNCLCKNYTQGSCPSSRRCKDCGAPHHTLLHRPMPTKSDELLDQKIVRPPGCMNLTPTKFHEQALYKTAIVTVQHGARTQ